LLCLFVSAVLITMGVVAVLAVGVLFGMVWCARKGALLLMKRLVRRTPPAMKGWSDVVELADPRLPGQVRSPSRLRNVRVQNGLVPASSCLAQRHLGGVPQWRRRRARERDE